METQEQIKAMDGKRGREDGWMWGNAYYTQNQWDEEIKLVRESCPFRTAERIINRMTKEVHPVSRVWTMRVHYSFAVKGLAVYQEDVQYLDGWRG